ncbi:hypothetical protein ZOSMA_182G00180 [Zostera marina]|uniref:SAUR-like auxin-responsive protein family n=1 Tax=Zostera marina TaxID=29655 RepID=A0A0K9PQI2_ZOSMR|nr:hypothetical protein ZOSMA_182G00180 [Zostera marina]
MDSRISGGGKLKIAMDRRRQKMKQITLGGKRDRPITKGTTAVYVGEEKTRYVIPVKYFSTPEFAGVMEMVKEEFGFSHSGGIRIPCSVEEFEGILFHVKETHVVSCIHPVFGNYTPRPLWASGNCRNLSQEMQEPIGRDLEPIVVPSRVSNSVRTSSAARIHYGRSANPIYIGHIHFIINFLFYDLLPYILVIYDAGRLISHLE